MTAAHLTKRTFDGALDLLAAVEGGREHACSVIRQRHGHDERHHGLRMDDAADFPRSPARNPNVPGLLEGVVLLAEAVRDALREHVTEMSIKAGEWFAYRVQPGKELTARGIHRTRFGTEIAYSRAPL